jgi:lysosomal acid phosphatase
LLHQLSSDRVIVNIMSAVFAFILTAAILPIAASENAPANSRQLVLVQLLYRHGDRTPINAFPTDPNKDYFNNIGPGQLTPIGKEQHFVLGKYLRTRYADFLSARYHVDNVTVRSTDIDRTLMSAYCNFAGLFPPQGDQIWDSTLPWQPIPVHTVPQNDDWVLLADNCCDKYKKLFEEAKHSDDMKKLDEENEELYKNLTQWTGTNITNIFDVGEIYDVLFIENLYNLSLPKWAESVLPIMNKLKSVKIATKTSTVTLARLRGGPLVGEMVKNMQDKIKGVISTKQLFVYSAHDTTVSAFLAALQLYDGIPPPYAATVFVELYQVNDSFVVEVSYKNSTGDPTLLAIPGCAATCPFTSFVELYQGVIPKDIKAECKLDDGGFVGNASLTGM